MAALICVCRKEALRMSIKHWEAADFVTRKLLLLLCVDTERAFAVMDQARPSALIQTL